MVDVGAARASHSEIVASLELLFANSPQPMLAIDRSGRIQFATRSTSELFAAGNASLIGVEIPQLLISPTVRDLRDSASFPPCFRASLVEAPATSYDIQTLPLTLSNECEGWQLWMLRPTSPADSAIRPTPAANELSGAGFRKVLDAAASEAISILAIDGQHIYSNYNSYALSGRTQEDMRNQPPFAFVHPDDIPMLQQQWKLLTSQPEQRVGPNYLRIRHADGHWFWVEACGVNMLSDPDVAGIVTNWRVVEQQRQTQARLQENQILLDLALTAAQMVAWDWNILTGKLKWTSEEGQVYGISPLQDVDSVEKFLQLVHPEDRQLVGHLIQRSVQTGLDYFAEYRVQWPDGSTHWVDARGRVYRDEAGKPERMVGVSIDIDQRKSAERQLREREMWLRMAMSSARLAPWELDLRTGRVLGNELIGRMFDVDMVNEVGSVEEFMSRIIDEDRPRVEEAIRIATQRCEDYLIEFRVRHRNGQTHWLEGHGRVHSSPSGEALRMVGVTLDIDHRKETEAMLAESEERLRLTLEAAMVGTWEWNPKTNSVAGSPELGPMYGRPRGMVHNSVDGFLGAIHPQDRDMVRAAIVNALTGDGQFAQDYRVIWPDGSVHWVADRGRTIFDAKGEATRMLGAVIDITKRKEIEQQLRESQEQYRLLADSMEDFVSLSDLNRHAHYVSPSFFRITGYTPEEIAATDFSSRIHEDDVARVELARLDNLRGLSTRIEYRFRCKTGHYIWLDLKATPVGLGDGIVDRIVCCARDITDRKIAEEAARQSEARYRDLVELSPEAIGIVQGGLFVYGNPAAVELLGGRNIDDLLGVRMEEVIHPDDLASTYERVQTVVATHQPVPLRQIRAIRRDGRIITIETRVGPCAYGGKPAVQVIGRDVTKRLETEEALRESEARWRSLVENAPDIIMMVDRSGVIRFINKIAKGYSEDEVVGANSLSLISPSSQLRARDAYARAWDYGETVDFEIEATPQEGEGLYFEVRVSPIRSGEKTVALINISRDITDRKRLAEERLQIERKLQETQRLESLGLLAGGVAHDFNNLLTGVINYTSLAWSQVEDGSQAQQFLERAETAARRAADLTRQLLAYSGRGKLVTQPVNLTNIVDEMRELLQTSISKRVSFSLHLERHLPSVTADATQLRQVIMNLILNASEAMGGENGTLTLRTQLIEATAENLTSHFNSDPLPPGMYACLEVSDTGCGMSPATLARIFDPFFSTKFAGRGLGLSAVLGIVRGHNGTIQVQSEVGVGTTFRVLLPAHAADLQPIEALVTTLPAMQPATGISPMVLLIDDEEVARLSVEAVLLSENFRVELAASGREGLDLFAKVPDVDLVILDLTMPDLDGEQVFRLLRQSSPDVRVIITSGYSTEEIALRHAGDDRVGFVQKATGPRALLSEIRRILGR